MKMEAMIRMVPVELIIPNRFQPRLSFDEDGLKELAESIREHGIIQPLVLRRIQDKYEIIAGERRYKASQMCGMPAVPAIIVYADDNESAEVAIIENTHRRNLSAIEEAKSYKQLLDRNYLTQDQLAKRLGTSQSNIANKIRLLSLDDNVQNALNRGEISERHARTLLRLTDKPKQVELLNLIIKEKWSVKKLEDEVNHILGVYQTPATATGGINVDSRNDIDIDSIEVDAEDLGFDNTESEYVYHGKNTTEQGKDSLLFNNLENEAVSFNTGLGFGGATFKEEVPVEDIEELDVDDDLFEDDAEGDTPQGGTTYIKPQYLDETSVLNEINNIIKKSRENGLNIEIEEFNFDDMYQYVFRIKKDNDEE
jgi:ParB family chromosome partitioning protein